MLGSFSPSPFLGYHQTKSILTSTCPLASLENHHQFCCFLIAETPLATSPPFSLLSTHIMTIASRIFSLPGLTIAGAAEYLVIVKFLPNYFSLHDRYTAVIGTILVNYAFGIIFWALLYPNFFSPLRRISGPKVSEA